MWKEWPDVRRRGKEGDEAGSSSSPRCVLSSHLPSCCPDDDDEEEWVAENIVQDVEFVVDLSAVDLVEELHQHKDVEDDSVVRCRGVLGPPRVLAVTGGSQRLHLAVAPLREGLFILGVVGRGARPRSRGGRHVVAGRPSALDSQRVSPVRALEVGQERPAPNTSAEAHVRARTLREAARQKGIGQPQRSDSRE